MPDTEIPAALPNVGIESLRQALDRLSELRLLQAMPELRVGVLLERVEIRPNAAAEQCRILRQHGEGPPELLQPNCGNVKAVDRDCAAVELLRGTG